MPQNIKKELKEEPSIFIPNKPLEEIEKQYIYEVLKENNWNKSKSAKTLGIERRTLYNKIEKYRLKKAD